MTTSYMRQTHAVIRIVGVGGGGSNAVNRMIDEGLSGVEFIAVNTDSQALRKSKAPTCICIGERSNRGLGAGGDPAVGERAADDTNDELYEMLQGADMVFIAAGMGGGTGTGAAPKIASIAKDLGILTVAIVTKPFSFEGRKRMNQADQGIAELRKYVDALVVVPNDRLQDHLKRDATILNSFQVADSILRDGVRGISDLITKTGVVNVDFADVSAVLRDAGEAIMAMGNGTGPDRVMQAINAAKQSDLLDVELTGAQRVLINITSGPGILMTEISQAVEEIEAVVDEEANIIWGSVIDPAFPDDKVSITLVATGTNIPRQRSVGIRNNRASLGSSRDQSQGVLPKGPQVSSGASSSNSPKGREPQIGGRNSNSSRFDEVVRTDVARTPPPPPPSAKPSLPQTPLAVNNRMGNPVERSQEQDISIPPRMRQRPDNDPGRRS
jgi:cell division protein FtsZ